MSPPPDLYNYVTLSRLEDLLVSDYTKNLFRKQKRPNFKYRRSSYLPEESPARISTMLVPAMNIIASLAGCRVSSG